jgi:hypothetical protein
MLKNDTFFGSSNHFQYQRQPIVKTDEDDAYDATNWEQKIPASKFCDP